MEFGGITRNYAGFGGITRNYAGFGGITRDLAGLRGIWRDLAGLAGLAGLGVAPRDPALTRDMSPITRDMPPITRDMSPITRDIPQIEKHLCEEEDLYERVGSTYCHSILSQVTEYQGLMKSCYPDSGVTFEFREEDIRRLFDVRISQKKGSSV